MRELTAAERRKICHATPAEKKEKGRRLRECRKANSEYAKEWTFAKTVQKKSGRKCSEKYLSGQENGRLNLTIDYAQIYGDLLGVDPEYLLLLTDFKNDKEREMYEQGERNAEALAEMLQEIVKKMSHDFLSSDTFMMILNDMGYVGDDGTGVDENGIRQVWLGSDVKLYKDGEFVGTISYESRSKLQTEIYEYAQFLIEKRIDKREDD